MHSEWVKKKSVFCLTKIRLCSFFLTELTLGAPLDMPTSCVELDHCGTHYPIWVDNKLPDKPGERVPLEGCVNTGS